MDIMAQKLGMDPAEFRMKNLIRREQFPYTSALGWEYDSGDYHTALNKAMDTVDYRTLRAEQKEKQEAFKRGAKLIELRLDFLARSPDCPPCPGSGRPQIRWR